MEAQSKTQTLIQLKLLADWKLNISSSSLGAEALTLSSSGLGLVAQALN